MKKAQIKHIVGTTLGSKYTLSEKNMQIEEMRLVPAQLFVCLFVLPFMLPLRPNTVLSGRAARAPDQQ
jgi:hypothetical protein